MAFLTDTRPRQAGAMERATQAGADWLAELSAKLRRHRIYADTYAELSRLSDRELLDLGLARGDLRRIALENAYGR
jgi:uncharacterized protein YjiS (DUF1127 family)